MKKTLIALAALAATGAFAQSSVTLKGTFDPSFAHSTTTTNGVDTNLNFVRNNSQGTSQITFVGTEDLGGGLTANFLYEGDFTVAEQASATNGIGNGGGEVYAGLAGAFGSLKVGGPNTPSLTTQGSRQPFGTKIGSGFKGVLGGGHVRESNSFVYATPTFSGLSAAVGASAATAAAAAKYDFGVNYANGPVAAGVSYYTQENVNKQTNVFASYVLGAAKIIVGYHNEDATVGAVTNNSTGMNIAGTYAVTPSVTLLGNYAQLDDKAAANADKTIAAFGARYDLSKRTSVYARYVSESNDNAGVGVSAIKTTLVGMQHNF